MYGATLPTSKTLLFQSAVGRWFTETIHSCRSNCLCLNFPYSFYFCKAFNAVLRTLEEQHCKLLCLGILLLTFF